jgi:hypothetical protein
MRRKLIPVTALIAIAFINAAHPSIALAQRPVVRGAPRGVVFVGGYFYDPFFGPYPWWGPAAYAYPYFPIYDQRAQVRLIVTPKDAAVYVDGYYAGISDDFDGVLQSLPLSPGGHEITVYLDGYKTVHQRLYLPPGKSLKVRYAMEPVGAGQTSEPPPVAPPVPPPPPGSAMLPRAGSPGAPRGPFFPAPATAASAQEFGTLALRVQPADAEVLIDGQQWTSSGPEERLLVQLSAGTHAIEVRRQGYRTYSSNTIIQPGVTTTVNLSLSSQ